jgi:zinc transport system ATP-binding protein
LFDPAPPKPYFSSKNLERKMPANFEAYCDGKLIFASSGHWLHPLFDFSEFLSGWNDDRSRITVQDKIVGRAAALIMAHLGIAQIHACTISRPAIDALEYHRVRFSYDEITDQIACRTEILLRDEISPQRAYETLDGLRRSSSAFVRT